MEKPQKIIDLTQLKNISEFQTYCWQINYYHRRVALRGKDVMGCTQHNHVAVVIAESKNPEGDEVAPPPTLPVWLIPLLIHLGILRVSHPDPVFIRHHHQFLFCKQQARMLSCNRLM